MVGRDGEDVGNLFLAAIAAGAESTWADGDPAKVRAYRLRQELMSFLGGAQTANALLRSISRDGRLHPGLAPKVSGRIVNSEKNQMTPRQEADQLFADAAARIAGGAAPP